MIKKVERKFENYDEEKNGKIILQFIDTEENKNQLVITHRNGGYFLLRGSDKDKFQVVGYWPDNVMREFTHYYYLKYKAK